MTPETLAMAIMAIMVQVAPPGRQAPAAAAETADEARTRYAAIALDIATVVQDEAPLPGMTRQQTALVMAATSYAESGWRRDVDTGAKRGPAGDCTIFQLHAGVREGCPALLADRRKAAGVALRMMRQSFRACARNKPEHRLAAYASGTCGRGWRESKVRLDLARRWEPRLSVR